MAEASDSAAPTTNCISIKIKTLHLNPDHDANNDLYVAYMLSV